MAGNLMAEMFSSRGVIDGGPSFIKPLKGTHMHHRLATDWVLFKYLVNILHLRLQKVLSSIFIHLS